MDSAAVSSEMKRVKLMLLLLLVAVTAWLVATPTAAEGGVGPFFRWYFSGVRLGGGMDFGGGCGGRSNCSGLFG